MEGVQRPTVVAEALAALARVDQDPRRASREAQDAVARAESADDPGALSVALRAAGLAELHLAHLDTAAAHLEAAVRTARRADSRRLAAEARMSLAFVRARRGEVRRAVRCIDLALADLEGVARARALTQRGAIRQQLGHVEDALADYRAAMPELQAAGDWVWVQRIHGNQGQLFAHRSDFARAEAELDCAEEICRRQGLEMKLAFVHENRALLETRRGDVPAALRHLLEAERRHEALGAAVGAVLVDRSELLLSVGLAGEAGEAAHRAVEDLTRSRRRINLPEAQLLVATAALLAGDPGGGRVAAEQAARLFSGQRRPAWAALARHVGQRCRLALPGERPVTTRELVSTADLLATSGWVDAALDARLLAGRVLLQRGQVQLAREQLELARPAGRSLPAATRARSWYAEALLRSSSGHRRSALQALTSGLRILDEHQATLGAADLRASVSTHRAELVELGLRLALETGRARSVLTWAERGRAAGLLLRPARPPDDPALQEALAELRALAVQQASADSGPPAAHLVRRQVALERTVRDLARLEHGASRTGPHGAALVDLLAALGDDALVEYVELDGRLRAVTVVAGTVRVHELPALTCSTAALASIPFALHRLARRRSTASTTAAAAALTAAAEQLDAALLRPLQREIGDRSLVVVPTGPLQALPFGLLPSLRGRPVTLAPSATLWWRAVGAEPRPGPVLVVAGPGLPAAPGEARAVAALYEDARLVTAEDATTRAVSRALPEARLAHIAAHGHLRADNPLFSSLLLADGPLSVYDLEGLPSVPPLVVLAACDTARSTVTSGDELLGLAARFLGLGTGTLIAPMAPIADGDTAALMVALHERLRTGIAPAVALADLQRSIDDPATSAAAAGLVCLGGGRALSGSGGCP